MSRADEKKLEKLTNQTIDLLNEQNALEKTFSRVKNETEELLRKQLKKSGNKRQH